MCPGLKYLGRLSSPRGNTASPRFLRCIWKAGPSQAAVPRGGSLSPSGLQPGTSPGGRPRGGRVLEPACPRAQGGPTQERPAWEDRWTDADTQPGAPLPQPAAPSPGSGPGMAELFDSGLFRELEAFNLNPGAFKALFIYNFLFKKKVLRRDLWWFLQNTS